MIPVAANDVAFSIHAVALTAITLFQIAIYEVGNQFTHLQLLFLVKIFANAINFYSEGIKRYLRLL